MFWQQRVLPTVSFATTVWEKDWRPILLDPEYLSMRQIGNHAFPFSDKVLIINNVKNPILVKAAAEMHLRKGVLSRYVVVEDFVKEMLSFFHLERSDFCSDWVYYNALGPLAALFTARSDYLLYVTGDVSLEKRVHWIKKAILRMEKMPQYKVANLIWNGNVKEVRKESYKKEWNFYVANQGFSDQMFLVKVSDFRQPIYGEIRSDSYHFPRGNVWERRVFSTMKNRGWERIIYRYGCYTHKNFV